MTVMLQSENGLLGIGPFPMENEVDPDLINAGKTNDYDIAGFGDFLVGGQLCNDPRRSHQSGHPRCDAGVGAWRPRQLDEFLAKWSRAWVARWIWLPGVERVIVVMEHTAKKKDGGIDLKILPQCNLPLTGVGVVNMIITDLGVLDVTKDGLKLVELAPGVTKEELAEKTGAKVH